MSRRVAVIGGGIAGISAALQASLLGAEVEIWTGTPGETALSWGCLSHEPLLFSQSSSPPFLWQPEEWQALQEWRETSELWQLLVSALPSLITFTSVPKPLLSSLGTLFWCSVAPAGIMAGELSSLLDDSEAVIGLVGFPPYFEAEAMAALCNQRYSPQFHSVTLPSLLPSSNPFLWARLWESEEHLETLLKELREFVAMQDQPSLLLFPPIMGLQDSLPVLERLQKELGVRCAEWLPSSPSVPGKRLYDGLLGLLIGSDILVHPQRVERVQTQEGKLQSVHWLEAGQEKSSQVEEVILATGQWIGGGLRDAVETLLALPTHLPSTRHPWKKQSPEQVTWQEADQSHPLFERGVWVNEAMQPMDQDGHVLYSNLRVAGSLVAAIAVTSSNPNNALVNAQERTLGRALLQGERAAIMAVGEDS